MDTTNVNVRISGHLKQHLEHQIGEDGLYENASEYIRDLIRRDRESLRASREWLKQELEPGLRAPKGAYVAVSADDVIKRNKTKTRH